MKSITLGIAILFLLASCASSTDAGYSLSAAIHPLSQDKAQLALYYPYSIFWGGKAAHVSIGEHAGACDLKTGTFYIRDIKPGLKTTISASLCGVPGTSRIIFKTLAGGKYYIRIAPNDTSAIGRIGNAGLAKPKEEVIYGGPFRIDIIEETAALMELRKLTACTLCMAGDTAFADH